MKRTFWLVSCAVLLCVVCVSCKKENKSPNFHYDYFPLQEGRYVIYSVQEVHIDNSLALNDTVRYYLKAVIGDTITDNEGRIARRYERYVRDSLNQTWTLKDIWTAIIVTGRAELVEENQRTIKLVFAPSKYKEWNCNAYNMLDPLDCYYQNLHKPSAINGFDFDSTITVEQEEFKSLVDYRRKFEQYAKGVGMYYKHYKDYRLNNSLDTLNVNKGTELIMRLIDYGVE